MHLKVLTLLVAFTASALADQYSFESYQINFGKEYSSPKEYVQRKAIFESNVNEILKHNKMKGVSYTKGINKFTDMTQKEIESQIEGKISLTAFFNQYLSNSVVSNNFRFPFCTKKHPKRYFN